MDVKAIFDGTRKKELDDINEANKKAEEWQYEDHDNKSLQTYIAEIVQKEVDDIRYVNNLISTKEETLTKRLDDAESALSETKEKNEQLEGLLRLYAAATAKDTVFNPFTLGSVAGSPDQAEIFNLLKGFSANLNFTVEDDPNWRASAYSELLFNGVVVSNDRSYTGTVNSDLTVKHRNTLTGKESITKTIRFVEATEPDKNPTGLSWLTQADSNNVIYWRSHLPELTAAAVAQNSQYGWPTMQQDFQYSRDDGKTWELVTYDFATMFGNSDKIYLQVDCKQYDRLGNLKECIINLGNFTKNKFQYDYTEYSIASTATVKVNNIPRESFTLYGLKSSDISVDDLLSKNSTGVTSTGGGLRSTNFSISASQIVVDSTTYTYQANLSTSTQRVYRYTSSVSVGNTSTDVVQDITLTINSTPSKAYYAVK